MLKLIKMTGLFCIGVLTVFWVTTESAFAAESASSEFISDKVISDSLVENLQCSNFSIDHIYKGIRADAFEVSRHIPRRNWLFNNGLVTLGACWGLSSAQRRLFYLGRYDDGEMAQVNESETIPTILDHLRGGRPERVMYEGAHSKRLVTTPLRQYSVFSLGVKPFMDSLSETESLWQKLLIGFTEYTDGVQVRRNFKSEIESNQLQHFYRRGNLEMVKGDRSRTAQENRETVETLLKNLDGKRLTLLNIRTGRFSQHIVLAKSYFKVHGFIYFLVYDSNAPHTNSWITYESSTSMFTSPQVAQRLDDPDHFSPLGVYVVDEQERDLIDAALITYYREQCR